MESEVIVFLSQQIVNLLLCNLMSYSYYRSIKTTQERKNNTRKDNFESIFEIKIRPKRKGKMLPDSWDDIGRCSQRSWKLHRKNQYKFKG